MAHEDHPYIFTEPNKRPIKFYLNHSTWINGSSIEDETPITEIWKGKEYNNLPYIYHLYPH